MKTTKNIRNSEYRIYKSKNFYSVWLVSTATGSKLKCVANTLTTEEMAQEFIAWVKTRE